MHTRPTGFVAVLAIACSAGAQEAGEDTGARATETSAQRVARIIEEYDAQGAHRTGSDVDEASARWLAAEVRRAGLEPELESIPFSKIDVLETYIVLGEERIEALPLWDGPFTGPEGIVGSLGSSDDRAADIGMIEIPAAEAGGTGFHQYRRSTAHRAVIAITGGARWGLPEGMALVNAESYTEPYGPPTVQVGSEALPRLKDAAAQSMEVRVVHHARRRETEVFNVTATYRGSDPSLPPLVVMTPRSGWWQCASERGGGLAVWVEMMHAITAAQPAASVHFVASTGHELGHYGLGHYMARRESLMGDAVAWIHLGANFGAAVGSEVLFQASDEEYSSLAVEAMARYGKSPEHQWPVGDRPLGEAREVFDGGGRYVSILGRNRLFHHPLDRWPEAVDLESVEAFARAFSDIALELTGGQTDGL